MQDAEILRLRRELDEAARREQEMREHVRREREVANNAPLPLVTQPLNEAPQPIQVSPPQVTQVPAPVTHQVSDFAAQAVEALRAPAQTAQLVVGFAGFPTVAQYCYATIASQSG